MRLGVDGGGHIAHVSRNHANILVHEDLTIIEKKNHS